MNGKQFAIEGLEHLLKKEEEQLDKHRRNIELFKGEVGALEPLVEKALTGIAGLKDAIHKLRGLDNLEKKNKIPDGVGYMIYEEYEKEKKRRDK